jgi:4-amino-4-deoxy-L-arabinose transferase-like glycosyltransferase
MFKKSNNNTALYVAYLIIFLGIIFRFYNLSFENLWFDEIVSFWVSDPKISFFESYERNNIGEGTPFLFNFLIKILHFLFGYSPNVGRYFSCTISVLSIFSMIYLAKIIKDNNSYLLIIFLVSMNIFFIKYSQESRVYSLVFFLCTLSLIFYFKLLKENSYKKYFSKNSLYFVIFQILAILSHPFTLIIFGSIILYTILIAIFKNKSIKTLNTSIFTIIFFIGLYLPYYLTNTEPYPTWVSHPEVKFYTNFYFSKFFGSRLLGLVHLLILFYLIFKFRKKFTKNLEPSTVLTFVIFFSYFIPITFGYLYQPILAPRYIIFVLIPIIALISYLTFEIVEKKIRYFIVSILIFLTLGNLSTETTIKQFFKERPNHKPEYILALKEINKTKYKEFAINLTFAEKNKHHFNLAINNYFKQIITKDKLNIKPVDLKNIKNDSYFWLVCLTDLNTSSCNIPIDSKFKVLDEKNYNSTNLKLIKSSN